MAQPTSPAVSSWLAELAQPKGSPGGGAAGAVMLGISAALMRMVAAYTPDDSRVAESAGRLARLREEALDAADEDGARSAAFGAALALPADDPTRAERVRGSAVDAARSSAMLGAVGIRLIPELRLLVSRGNPALAADLAIAAEALVAGLSGASVNLRANLQTARRHDLDQPLADALHEDGRRLAAARSAAAEISADLSVRFDEESSTAR